MAWAIPNSLTPRKEDLSNEEVEPLASSVLGLSNYSIRVKKKNIVFYTQMYTKVACFW